VLSRPQHTISSPDPEYAVKKNAGTHEHDEVEIVVRAAAGRQVLLYLPTYSPWLNPIEMRLPPVSP
jgi:hypothetical protein